MRRLLVAAFAAALSFPAVAGAAAEPVPGSGCSFAAVSPGLDGDYTGVIYSEPVVAAAVTGDPLANPVSITVYCTLHVYWSAYDPGTEVSGSGVGVAVVAPTQVTYHSGDEDFVLLCTRAVLTDAHGVTRTYYQNNANLAWSPFPACNTGGCLSTDENCVPTYAFLHWALTRVKDVVCPGLAGDPDAYAACAALPTRWQDAADGALDAANAVIDTIVCGALGALAPGFGPVGITPEGDVYVDGEFTWDCPPYA